MGVELERDIVGSPMRRPFLTLLGLLAVSLASWLAFADTSVPSKAPGKPTVSKTGLKMYELRLGGGDEAVKGKRVRVHYTGWLTTGKKFDSSVDRGEPFEFQLGRGMVIKGWDEGVTGMRVGGMRQLH